MDVMRSCRRSAQHKHFQRKSAKRTCIIGAGYCGLSTARYMKEYGVNFTVFEATKHVGGTWRFDPRIGTDEDGLPLFTSMYRNLRINIPRMTMEYTGFPFPKGTQSYPTGECFYKYLKLFTKEYGLYKHIQFKSLVTAVMWVNDFWSVTYIRTDTKQHHTEECDFLVIANGEFRTPVWPKFKNQDSFKGNMIHSHDYRDPESFRDRRVLVVGAGPSGLDMALHLANIAAKVVHSHHRTLNLTFKGYVKKPDIKQFNASGAFFKDNSFEVLDDVIFCTGYNLSYPFLDTSSGVVTSNKYILPLYQHMVNILHPTMVFVGTPKLLASTVREAQTEYAAALASGQFKLPSKEIMLRSWASHVDSLKSNKETIEHVNLLGEDYNSYLIKLSQEAGIYSRPPVLTHIKDFNAKNRLEDLLNYRDYDFEIIDEHNFTRRYNPRRGNPCPFEI